MDDKTAQVLAMLGILATGLTLITTGNAEYLWLLVIFVWLCL